MKTTQMLTHPTLDQLKTLKLDGMADAFIELQSQAQAAELAHAEWLALLLDREAASRNTRRFQVRLRSARLRHGHAVIEVRDDGLGMSEERLERAFGGGIGLSNVNERLRTIYGVGYHIRLTSQPGQGTCATLDIPELMVAQRVPA